MLQRMPIQGRNDYFDRRRLTPDLHCILVMLAFARGWACTISSGPPRTPEQLQPSSRALARCFSRPYLAVSMRQSRHRVEAGIHRFARLLRKPRRGHRIEIAGRNIPVFLPAPTSPSETDACTHPAPRSYERSARTIELTSDHPFRPLNCIHALGFPAGLIEAAGERGEGAAPRLLGAVRRQPRRARMP